MKKLIVIRLAWARVSLMNGNSVIVSSIVSVFKILKLVPPNPG